MEMPASTNQERLGAYGLSLQLDGYVQHLESLATRLQQMLLSDSESAQPQDLPAILDDLRRTVQRTERQLSRIEESVGHVPIQDGKTVKSSVRVPANGLRGSTRTIALPDLIGLLGGQKKTGTLHLKARDEYFVLELLDGSIVHIVTNAPREDQRIGTILVGRNCISPEDLDEFLSDRDLQSEPLGAALARANLVSEGDLLDALSEQVQGIFERIFDLDFCQFFFLDGEVRNLEHRVRMNTTRLLLDCARKKDERRDA